MGPISPIAIDRPRSSCAGRCPAEAPSAFARLSASSPSPRPLDSPIEPLSPSARLPSKLCSPGWTHNWASPARPPARELRVVPPHPLRPHSTFRHTVRLDAYAVRTGLKPPSYLDALPSDQCRPDSETPGIGSIRARQSPLQSAGCPSSSRACLHANLEDPPTNSLDPWVFLQCVVH